MPQILTTNAIVKCPHGGVGTSIPAWPFWSIQGGIALREGDTGTLTCPFLPPCSGYLLRSMGLNATKLDGSRAILVTDFNQTLTGLPLTMVEAHSVIDNSMPAPIPAGENAPPLSDELLDIAPPVVTPATPVTVFNSVTQLPSALPIVFSLFASFPLQWILTRVSEPPNATHEDLTNGVPPGAVVLPAGGNWANPALQITLTLNAAYMTALGVGIHHFYMTGVTQRGISSWAECILTVS